MDDIDPKDDKRINPYADCWLKFWTPRTNQNSL